jgi:hypothetical protein
MPAVEERFTNASAEVRDEEHARLAALAARVATEGATGLAWDLVRALGPLDTMGWVREVDDVVSGGALEPAECEALRALCEAAKAMARKYVVPASVKTGETVAITEGSVRSV